MKRLVIYAMILITALTFVSCGDVPAQAPAGSQPGPEDTVAETEAPKIDVGFSLVGEGAFSDQLAIDIKSECASLNIVPQISIAASAEQQRRDISSMLLAGASVLVVVPLDADSLETMLAECETYDVRVINALDPVNGSVNMLISPDYKEIGKKAGQAAAELLGASGGGCMLLNTDYDSFTMQMMTDGFTAAVAKNKNISIVSEPYCGSDEELAYTTTKDERSKKGIDFIFAQNAALGRGAMRAIEESGKDVKAVVFGGDMDIISAVSSGKVYASIFVGPRALAREAVSHADKFIKSGSYAPPQYTQLPVVVVKQADASGYYAENEPHAQAK
jgi:ribose transport system substrate-binding protein